MIPSPDISPQSQVLFQEVAEFLGLRTLRDKLVAPHMQPSFVGLFPKDTPKNTRFAINFWTAIGLGGITDGLREHLQNAVSGSRVRPVKCGATWQTEKPKCARMPHRSKFGQVVQVLIIESLPLLSSTCFDRSGRLCSSPEEAFGITYENESESYRKTSENSTE